MKKPISHSKIAIIGVGNVGAATAFLITTKNLAAEILLIDREDKKESGEVMDIADGLCFSETGNVTASDYRDARDADIIVIAAGANQKPGESRLDLFEKNKAIMTSIFAKIGKIKQSSIIVVISNPVDILTKIIQDIVPLPNSQIFGTGTSLDTARLKTELGLLLGVSPQSIEGYVMGEHGDTEFVAWDSVTVGGIPARKIRDLNVSVRKRTEERVRKEAYNIIKKKGATYFGIAQVAVDILEAILYDQKKILPVCALLTRYNGVSGICLGAPAVVGRNGVERHWPLELRGNEKKRFQASAKKIKSYL